MLVIGCIVQHFSTLATSGENLRECNTILVAWRMKTAVGPFLEGMMGVRRGDSSSADDDDDPDLLAAAAE